MICLFLFSCFVCLFCFCCYPHLKLQLSTSSLLVIGQRRKRTRNKGGGSEEEEQRQFTWKRLSLTLSVSVCRHALDIQHFKCTCKQTEHRDKLYQNTNASIFISTPLEMHTSTSNIVSNVTWTIVTVVLFLCQNRRIFFKEKKSRSSFGHTCEMYRKGGNSNGVSYIYERVIALGPALSQQNLRWL